MTGTGRPKVVYTGTAPLDQTSDTKDHHDSESGQNARRYVGILSVSTHQVLPEYVNGNGDGDGHNDHFFYVRVNTAHEGTGTITASVKDMGHNHEQGTKAKPYTGTTGAGSIEPPFSQCKTRTEAVDGPLANSTDLMTAAPC